jgi:hypothetical protein
LPLREEKCGSLRTRLMMDLDGNSVVSRQESVTRASVQADSAFDRIAGINGSQVKPASVVEDFRKNDAGR